MDGAPPKFCDRAKGLSRYSSRAVRHSLRSRPVFRQASRPPTPADTNAIPTERIVKWTGAGNVKGSERYFVSAEHFTKNLAFGGRLPRHDRLLAQNFVTQEFAAWAGPKLFFTKEPPMYMAAESVRGLAHPELRPWLFRYDDPEPERRMYFTALPENLNDVAASLEATKDGKRPCFCCLVNRFAPDRGEGLLGERLRFVRAAAGLIDLYGRSGPGGWNVFPNYRGPTKDKLATLKQYTFTLAFENSDIDGYVTEKIFHALACGSVPLYWGGGAYAAEMLPSGAYVECRGQEPGAVYERLRRMTLDEIVAYREAAIRFLSSSAARKFTWRAWAEAVLARFTEQESAAAGPLLVR